MDPRGGHSPCETTVHTWDALDRMAGSVTLRPSSHPSQLLRLAAAEGRIWAQEVRNNVRKELRRAAGGWPGTVSEARARLAEFVLPQLSRQGSAATSEDRERAARALYDSARRTWLAHCDREETP